MIDQYQQNFPTNNSISDVQSLDRETILKRIIEKLRLLPIKKLIAIEVLLNKKSNRKKKNIKKKRKKERRYRQNKNNKRERKKNIFYLDV